MEDRSQEIFGKYELTIYNTYRTRGAYVLDTDQGLKLLCGYDGGENRIEFEDSVKCQLIQRGYANVDGFVRNTEGAIISVNSVGDRFYLKDWFDGEECSLKKEDKIMLAASNLAYMHNCMKGIAMTDEQKACYGQTDLNLVLEKRARELKRVKSYIRERKQKNEFETCYLGVCEEFYEDALKAIDKMKTVPVHTMLSEASEKGILCHGSYTYHNIFILNNANGAMCKAAQLFPRNDVAVTNFEKTECGLQITDLYYFIRKVMEKNEWNLSLGRNVISEYQKQRKLSKEELKILSILLLFPEKFWKITNYYYNSKKSWIPQKNVQKLVTLSNQIQDKKLFLKTMFNVD